MGGVWCVDMFFVVQSLSNISPAIPRKTMYVCGPSDRSVLKKANMPFADFKPDKVARWLLAFEGDTTSSVMQRIADHVVKEQIDGNMILEAYIKGGGARGQGYTQVLELLGRVPNADDSIGGWQYLAHFKWVDSDRVANGKKKVSRNLKQVLSAGREFNKQGTASLTNREFGRTTTKDVRGKGEFEGMFKQKHFFAVKGLTATGPTRIGHFYTVELEEITDDDATRDDEPDATRDGEADLF